jgi:hypothetical protein
LQKLQCEGFGEETTEALKVWVEMGAVWRKRRRPRQKIDPALAARIQKTIGSRLQQDLMKARQQAGDYFR